MTATFQTVTSADGTPIALERARRRAAGAPDRRCVQRPVQRRRAGGGARP